jgi:hypothetical protein
MKVFLAWVALGSVTLVAGAHCGEMVVPVERVTVIADESEPAVGPHELTLGLSTANPAGERVGIVLNVPRRFRSLRT